MTQTFGEGLAALYLTKDELGIALASIAAAIPRVEENLRGVRSAEIRAALQERLVVANSLRTAFAEARYSLMTPEEIEQEKRDIAKAVAEGLIP